MLKLLATQKQHYIECLSYAITLTMKGIDIKAEFYEPLVNNVIEIWQQDIFPFCAI